MDASRKYDCKGLVVIPMLLLLMLSGEVHAICVKVKPGLCPGSASCMCTLFLHCATTSSQLERNSSNGFPPPRYENDDGTCAGQCRHVIRSGCTNEAFCYQELGECPQWTPAPIIPPPTSTPSPVRPSFVGMVRIPNIEEGNVWIDQFEASVEMLLAKDESNTSTWALHPFNIPLDALDANGTRYRAVSPLSINSSYIADHVMPQAYISQEQASNACLAANKRLCTLAEYMAACSSNGSMLFPYGEQHIPGACNEGHPNPIITVYGDNATFNFTEMNNPILDTLPDTLVPSGTYLQCTNNVTNTFDMSGNLDEWVADRTSEGHGIFKGGYFVDATINGPGCTYMTVAHAPTYHDYSLGFRCCFGS